MSTETQAVSQHLTLAQVIKLPAKAAFKHPLVIEQIVNVRKKFFCEKSEKAQAFAEREILHFTRMIAEKPELGNCETLSLYGCFLDMTALDLSFDPTYKHAYIVAYGQKAQLQIGGQAEMLLRQRCGQIASYDNPVMVYESESANFEVGLINGKRTVLKYMKNNNRKSSEKAIACFMFFTLPDGSRDCSIVDDADIEYYRSFSKQPNSLAWTKGYNGMFKTKCIKHAFKAYPKSTALQNLLDKAKFTKLESDAEEQEIIDIDYGIDMETGEVLSAPVQAPAQAPTVLSEIKTSAQAEKEPEF